MARELQRRAGDILLEICGRDVANFEEPELCARLVRQTDADAVINAVAYTAVDRAEDQEELAHAINAGTPGLIAQAAAVRGLPFVQISTNYVFDGAGDRPFRTDHPTGPLGVYGRSKLAGEAAVRAAGGPHAILRTSWVVSAHGNNFVKTMLRLGAERDRLTIVADQIGGPTCAADIADACLVIAARLCTVPEVSGIYHFSGGPDVSWADFAREIFAQVKQSVEVIEIPSSEFPTTAKRPLNSRLDNSTTAAVFGLSRPDWRRGLTDILTGLAVVAS